MRPAYNDLTCDVMQPDCPARALLTVLADKWALLLIFALSAGAQRTGALRRRVGGISEKMLIQTLRRLEGAGLVHRVSFTEVPPHVEYSLTKAGQSLSPLLITLEHWIEQHALDLP